MLTLLPSPDFQGRPVRGRRVLQERPEGQAPPHRLRLSVLRPEAIHATAQVVHHQRAQQLQDGAAGRPEDPAQQEHVRTRNPASNKRRPVPLHPP